LKQQTGSLGYAKEVAMRYSNDEMVTWYRKSADTICSNGGNMEKYWYIGLVTLCISAFPLVTVLLVCTELYGKKRVRANAVLPYDIRIVKVTPRDTTLTQRDTTLTPLDTLLTPRDTTQEIV
jgi:hypothetical protein